MAALIPASRATRKVPPHAGIKPSFDSGNPKRVPGRVVARQLVAPQSQFGTAADAQPVDCCNGNERSLCEVVKKFLARLEEINDFLSADIDVLKNFIKIGTNGKSCRLRGRDDYGGGLNHALYFYR